MLGPTGGRGGRVVLRMTLNDVFAPGEVLLFLARAHEKHVAIWLVLSTDRLLVIAQRVFGSGASQPEVHWYALPDIKKLKARHRLSWSTLKLKAEGKSRKYRLPGSGTAAELLREIEHARPQ
jgi:hypothetical protein